MNMFDKIYILVEVVSYLRLINCGVVKIVKVYGLCMVCGCDIFFMEKDIEVIKDVLWCFLSFISVVRFGGFLVLFMDRLFVSLCELIIKKLWRYG